MAVEREGRETGDLRMRRNLRHAAAALPVVLLLSGAMLERFAVWLGHALPGVAALWEEEGGIMDPNGRDGTDEGGIMDPDG
jgi:hypothetical protein